MKLASGSYSAGSVVVSTLFVVGSLSSCSSSAESASGPSRKQVSIDSLYKAIDCTERGRASLEREPLVFSGVHCGPLAPEGWYDTFVLRFESTGSLETWLAQKTDKQNGGPQTDGYTRG